MNEYTSFIYFINKKNIICCFFLRFRDERRRHDAMPLPGSHRLRGLGATTFLV